MNNYSRDEERIRLEESLMPQNYGSFGAMNALQRPNEQKLANVYRSIESLYYRAGEINSRNDIHTAMIKHAMGNCVSIAKVEEECLKEAPGGAEAYQYLRMLHAWQEGREIERVMMQNDRY